MIYEFDILPDPVVKHILDFYEFSEFKDGNMSGPKNKSVKYNLEMKLDQHYYDLRDLIVKHLWQSWEIKEILGIRKVSNLLFSKYDEGMFYGFHNDAYLMNGVRTDYSVTCFLSDPDEYEGGELELVVGNQSSKYKLPKGRAIIYPTGIKHKVHEVTKGSRKVLVFWMESCIQDPGIRDINVRLGEAWYKYKDRLLEEMPEIYDAILNTKFQLQRQFGNYEGL
jgi:PKHD-type hydroxylase